MTKYVHGRVRLATSTPRVREYDYGTKTYEPVDYYGDHFMYRDDKNLLPVRKGLYASYSPTPSQNALTAYPPQTLYSPHSSSYSQNWSPLSGVCKPCSMGYLGSGDVTQPSDEEVLAMLESGEIEPMNQEDAGWLASLGSWLGDIWRALTDWWNGLSEEEKAYYREEATKAIIAGASAVSDAETTIDEITGQAIKALPNNKLREAYTKIKANQNPYSRNVLGSNYNMVRSAILQEMIRRKLLTLQVMMIPSGINLTTPKNTKIQSTFCQMYPLDPKCQPKSSGSGDSKSGAGALILGAGALAVLASLLT